MAITNHERVGKAMDPLKQKVTPSLSASSISPTRTKRACRRLAVHGRGADKPLAGGTCGSSTKMIQSGGASRDLSPCSVPWARTAR